MSLRTYHEKRDFERTPEPKGRTRRNAAGLQYVLHKHAASRLHYDLRLEVGGVLKSWAVPKGPSLDPHEKRLAVQVEDHPLEYGEFEGTIPAGEYGGGTVMIWDRGTWEPTDDARAGLAKGRLKFQLAGGKLHGGWTLVRMGGAAGAEGKNWLLIKEQDRESRPQRTYDICSEQTTSVATGRSLEEIAATGGRAADGSAESAAGVTSRNKRTKRPSAAKTRGTAHARARQAVKAARGPPTRRGTAMDPGRLPGARRAAQPNFLPPQLATLTDKVPVSDEWLHEVKFDGYRLECVVRGGKVRLVTRNGHDWTDKFPTVARAAAALPVRQAILDGEVVALRENGLSDFQALQNALRDATDANSPLKKGTGSPLSQRTATLAYYVFDLPHCDGYDLTAARLEVRKEFLERLLARAGAGRSPLRYSDHIAGRGPKVFRAACRRALEGIVSKRADSAYVSKRSAAWLKIKCHARQEFVIGGYTDPAGARQGFGALLLGYYDGERLMYCGRVGTGFDSRAPQTILRELKSHAARTSAFHTPPAGAARRGVHWVRPELVAEVRFRGWTNAGMLRQPAFEGLRADKPAREVVREMPRLIPGAGRAARSRGRRTKTMKSTTVAPPGHDGVAGVPLTHPDRVLYPEQHLTKEALARFYELIGDWILPHVVDRPLALVRCPQGRQAKCFFQKHVTDALGAPIRGVEIREQNKAATHIVIDDLAGLITLVQLGALELHLWGARADDVEHPDRLIFDLDPGPGVAWKSIVAAARQVRDRLTDFGLRSFAKTSGGKGLHVVAPVARRVEWDVLREFARNVANSLAHAAPDEYLATMSKARRGGRIFIDYLRNGRGATCAAPYSTRARPAAPVSTPVDWDELEALSGGAEFTVENLPERLGHLRRDPWAGFFELRQSLTSASTRRARPRA